MRKIKNAFRSRMSRIKLQIGKIRTRIEGSTLYTHVIKIGKLISSIIPIKLLRRREFYFVLLIYPGLCWLSYLLPQRTLEVVHRNYEYYILTAVAFSIFIIAVTFTETLMRIFNYGLQGDKLRLRTREGVDVEELNDET